MRRKLLRDLFGVSGYRIVKPRFTGLVKAPFLRLSLRFFAGQALVLAAFWAAGHPWLYLTLWALPYFSYYQVANRLRVIAEHGGMTRTPDRRNTTHHVRQNRAARLFLVPYNVGYQPSPPCRLGRAGPQPAPAAAGPGGGRLPARGRGVARLPVAVAGSRAARAGSGPGDLSLRPALPPTGRSRRGLA